MRTNQVSGLLAMCAATSVTMTQPYGSTRPRSTVQNACKLHPQNSTGSFMALTACRSVVDVVIHS